MIAFKSIKDILEMGVSWERKIKDLYDVAEFGLENEKSKQVITKLKESHINKLQILENLDVEKYGLNEWVRFVSAKRDEDIIPTRDIRRDSTPDEIFLVLLECERKIKDFYSSVNSILVTTKQKELFDSLVKFKEIKIGEITNLKKNLE